MHAEDEHGLGPKGIESSCPWPLPPSACEVASRGVTGRPAHECSEGSFATDPRASRARTLGVIEGVGSPVGVRVRGRAALSASSPRGCRPQRQALHGGRCDSVLLRRTQFDRSAWDTRRDAGRPQHDGVAENASLWLLPHCLGSVFTFSGLIWTAMDGCYGETAASLRRSCSLGSRLADSAWCSSSRLPKA